ncbi:MAG: sterol desaturase family protein [Sphingomonadaceae bacterium]|nr:sterol desaturase family protein [Sphingomonadaceae bacterium]
MAALDQAGAWLLSTMGWWIVGLFLTFMLLELALPGNQAPRGGSNGSRLVTNFGMAALTAFLGLAIPFSSVIAAQMAQDAGFGLFNAVSAPWVAVMVVAVLSRSFLNYWVHRAFHAVPLLWRLHRIHHCDTHVDLSLSLRQHPLDYPPRLLAFAAGTALLGLPVWAVLIADLMLVATNYWEHVDGRMPKRLERALGLVFVTPEAHRLHHSTFQPQTDSNFGGGLIVWDRLFGTHRDPQAEDARQIGLEEVDPDTAAHIGRQLALPFVKLPRR